MEKYLTHDLTTHQWALYRYLEKVMLEENNRTVTVKELVEQFPDEYELRETEGNKSNCPKLYEDLKAITLTYQVDMIVCLNHNNIRLGTELDVLKRYYALRQRARWEEREMRVIEKKIKQHRNYKLCSNAGIPMDNASPDTKLWHTAFSDDNLALTIKDLKRMEKDKNAEKLSV